MGFHRYSHKAIVGWGRRGFRQASLGLQTWQAHRVRAIDVHPRDTPLEKGATVIVTLGLPWIALAAPCRIVGEIDEPDCWGFAYGTLPGHPEQGEEAFVVTLRGNEAVTLRVTRFPDLGRA